MNNNNENEINQIQEESKEGMEVARGTPCNSNADSSAVRGQGENQLIARSEDDGASPVEDSVAALFSYEARKQGMATALKGGMHQESMPRFGFQGQLKQPMGNKKVGAPMVPNADTDQLIGLLPHYGAAASKVLSGRRACWTSPLVKVPAKERAPGDRSGPMVLLVLERRAPRVKAFPPAGC